jgi:hypothetical protein
VVRNKVAMYLAIVAGILLLGIYLPKDVVREMDIAPKQKAVIKLLTRRRMVIEV